MAANDINLRKQQTHPTVATLEELKERKINNPHLVILFMEDLQENSHPRRILREADFVELRLATPITHPQCTAEPKEDIQVGTTIVWIVKKQMCTSNLAECSTKCIHYWRIFIRIGSLSSDVYL